MPSRHCEQNCAPRQAFLRIFGDRLLLLIYRQGVGGRPSFKPPVGLKRRPCPAQMLFPQQTQYRPRLLHHGTLNAATLDTRMHHVSLQVTKLLKKRGQCQMPVVCSPHPFKNTTTGAAFRLRFLLHFPLATAPTSVTVEFSLDEVLVTAPTRRHLTHHYNEPLQASILAYSLDEMIAEKLRALLQWTRQNVENGRISMPVARTYFDIWWLLTKKTSGLKQRILTLCSNGNVRCARCRSRTPAHFSMQYAWPG